MITTRILGAVLASVALVLSACGSDDGPSVTADVDSVPIAEEEDEPADEPTEEPEPEAEEEPEPAANESQRGNLIKELDEVAWVGPLESNTIDDAWFQFKITDIEVGDKADCTEDSGYSEPPENGHFLFITIVASTSSDWPEDDWVDEVYFMDSNFSVVGSDGVTENDVEGSALWCLASKDTMPNLGPGENATGKVVLDIGSESGVLVFKPWFVDGAGWEWEF
jgi:hypothetical protein